ncbi:MAG: hypothetical protein RAO94_11545 [Candidatus Stygibacter australis]|nr:hypothetical protein [Candidatus Stygibacter australis]
MNGICLNQQSGGTMKLFGRYNKNAVCLYIYMQLEYFMAGSAVGAERFETLNK